MALRYKAIKGKFKLNSGTRVAGGEAEIGIGVVEENLRVLRDPLTHNPYIPGSSLKGKVRHLLEMDMGRVNLDRDRDDDRGEPCMCGECPICKVFGAHKNTRHRLGPSRLIVRDAFLTAESAAELDRFNKETGLDSVEVKTENTIDRLTGTAKHPRTGERTLRGLEFDLVLSVRIMKDDDADEIMGLVRKGFKEFLPKDTIGGSGTRGYGWIDITEWNETDC